MDFDEYEYLEQAVEAVEPAKESNGVRNKDGSTTKRKADDDSHRQDDRSKKSRSGGDAGDRHERSDRGRSSQHEKDWEKSRDRVDRGREREPFERDFRGRRERERGFRFPGRHFDRERDRDAGRFRDKFFNRNRDFERTAEREKDKERDGKPIEREREHGGPRFPREKKEKKEETAAAEPEADPERDQRTVFAFQISLKADERDVYEFFSRAGKVRDVRLIMDRNSRRSKGVGYIEFYDAMSVPMAIALTGQPLLGQPVMVKPSEAEKNLVQSTAGAGAGGMMGPYSGGARRLYVGNLHYNITEDQLRQVFEPFGPVELVQLPTEPETGQCKGYGFVQYAKLEDARSAQQALNGILELAGRLIKVVAVTDQNMQETGVELDDDEGGGVSLTARSRALLMQKLDRSGTISSMATQPLSTSLGMFAGVSAAPTASPLVQGSALGQAGISGMIGIPNPGLGAMSQSTAAVAVPTDCLLLKNMFDPATETEPDFDLDIKDEVQSECAKFGNVKHIFVEKNSAGHVYLRFDNMNSAANAQRGLHGRWFAGKMLTATFLAPREYEAKFPDCPKVQ